MKLVCILTHSFDLDPVVEGLRDEGVHGLTIAEVVHSDAMRAPERQVTLRNEISVAIHDDSLERVVRGLRRARAKRELRVTIQSLTGAVRIRTGEVDNAALA